jgi:ADP-ribosylglycohydrolase
MDQNSLNFDKIKASIILAAIGDMIGFGNGNNEFNNGTSFSKDNYGDKYVEAGADYTNDLVFSFIYNGGFYEHPKPTWTVSDDTIMLLANGYGIINSIANDQDDIINNIRQEYIGLIKEKTDLDRFERVYKGGLTTIASLKKLKNGDDYKTFLYDEKAGGSGGSMRSMIFGTVFYKEADKLKLIENCIESTCLTHNNATAYLGALASAFFTSYALRDIEPNRWCFEFMELLESDIIDNYIKDTREKDYAFYERDKKRFINKWKDYMEDKFDDYDYKYKKSLVMKYPSSRSLYYNKFSERKKDMYPGAGGDDSVIIAYDCLLEANDNWEKLVIYSMLHVGDSDTTGIIAAYLYGSYYGMSKVYSKMIENMIDHKEEIIKFADDIYKLINSL